MDWGYLPPALTWVQTACLIAIHAQPEQPVLSSSLLTSCLRLRGGLAVMTRATMPLSQPQILQCMMSANGHMPISTEMVQSKLQHTVVHQQKTA